MVKELPLDISTWDEECMQTFIEQYAPLFRAFTSRYVEDSDIINDFLQEAYIKLWTHRKQIGQVSSVRNYFFTVLRNTILDKWSFHPQRQNINEQEYLNIASNETFVQHIIEAESSHLIAEAIEKLSPQSQQVIKLTLDGKTIGEIAELLNLSTNTIKTVKYRAIERLSEHLSKEDFFLFLLLFDIYKC